MACSDRPGSICAIFLQSRPFCAIISKMRRSSSARHLMRSSCEHVREALSEQLALFCAPQNDCECAFAFAARLSSSCRRDQRLRTPAAVRPGSCAATLAHWLPCAVTTARITASSSGRQLRRSLHARVRTAGRSSTGGVFTTAAQLGGKDLLLLELAQTGREGSARPLKKLSVAGLSSCDDATSRHCAVRSSRLQQAFSIVCSSICWYFSAFS
mmetsp:Transcript_32862/g.63262  ORF Transcript_32862/g.63262 Transcript_32862/m.63262 type:complete len:213 (-) Transcript_32862:346-984(-)